MNYFRPSIRFTVWCLDTAENLPLKLILTSEIEIYHFTKELVVHKIIIIWNYLKWGFYKAKADV
jgi:hypothetical protein